MLAKQCEGLLCYMAWGGRYLVIVGVPTTNCGSTLMVDLAVMRGYGVDPVTSPGVLAPQTRHTVPPNISPTNWKERQGVRYCMCGIVRGDSLDRIG